MRSNLKDALNKDNSEETDVQSKDVHGPSRFPQRKYQGIELPAVTAKSRQTRHLQPEATPRSESHTCSTRMQKVGFADDATSTTNSFSGPLSMGSHGASEPSRQRTKQHVLSLSLKQRLEARRESSNNTRLLQFQQRQRRRQCSEDVGVRSSASGEQLLPFQDRGRHGDSLLGAVPSGSKYAEGMRRAVVRKAFECRRGVPAAITGCVVNCQKETAAMTSHREPPTENAPRSRFQKLPLAHSEFICFDASLTAVEEGSNGLPAQDYAAKIEARACHNNGMFFAPNSLPENPPDSPSNDAESFHDATPCPCHETITKSSNYFLTAKTGPGNGSSDDKMDERNVYTCLAAGSVCRHKCSRNIGKRKIAKSCTAKNGCLVAHNYSDRHSVMPLEPADRHNREGIYIRADRSWHKERQRKEATKLLSDCLLLQFHNGEAPTNGPSTEEMCTNQRSRSSANSESSARRSCSRGNSEDEAHAPRISSPKTKRVLSGCVNKKSETGGEDSRCVANNCGARIVEESAKSNVGRCLPFDAVKRATKASQQQGTLSNLKPTMSKGAQRTSQAPQGASCSQGIRVLQKENDPCRSSCLRKWRTAQQTKTSSVLRSNSRASGVVAVRLLSAFGAPDRGRGVVTALTGGDESSDSSNSEAQKNRRNPAGSMMRYKDTCNKLCELASPANSASSGSSWLLKAAGARDASAANLVDKLELIMEKPLEPIALGALKPFGCLRQLILVQQHLSTLEELAVCKNLQLLHLPENHITTLNGIESCKYLEEVDLSGNFISDLECMRRVKVLDDPPGEGHRNALEELQRLHTLRLNSNRLKSLRGIDALRSLKEVQVANNQLTQVGEFLLANQQLERLNIAANHLWSLQDVTTLSRLPSLRVLLLSDVHFLSKQNPICRLKNHEMFALHHLPNLHALNQTLIDSGDSVFVTSTYQRKRLYYLLEQQQIRRNARDALKTLEELHAKFRVVIKQKRRPAELSLAREELCSGASFFRWAAHEVRTRREGILSTKRNELERFGNIQLEKGDHKKSWYRRTEERILRSFSAEDFQAFGFKSVRVKTIHRVVNKEAEAAFELLRCMGCVWRCRQSISMAFYRYCLECTSGDLFAERDGPQKANLIFVSSGLAEADLPRLHSLALNESIQAVAKHAIRLNTAADQNKASPALEGVCATELSHQASRETPPAATKATDPDPISLLQKVVKEGHMLLPDGEVLLCRALPHEPLSDSSFGYTAEQALELITNGPAEESMNEAGKLHQIALDEAKQEHMSSLASRGPTAIYRQRASTSQKRIWWFFERHCIVPHFLVRFSYSREPLEPLETAAGVSAAEKEVSTTADSSLELPAATEVTTALPLTTAAESPAGKAKATPAHLQEANSKLHGHLHELRHSPTIACGNRFFQDLIFMAEHLLALHTGTLQVLSRPQALQQNSSYAGDDAAGSNIGINQCGEVFTKQIVLEESQLRRLLSQSDSNLRVSRLGWASSTAASPTDKEALLGAGVCDAQLDCHGEIVSFTLSSIAHLIALSRGVLLSFLKLRVLLLPLNGLRSFKVPAGKLDSRGLSAAPEDLEESANRGSHAIELPQLRVLDLSFNELSTLDGFWAAPRLQQLCLVANHLLLLSDLAPVGRAAPQLRQLWIAGNPFYVGLHTSQPLQQLLPALELLDGRSLTGLNAQPVDGIRASSGLSAIVQQEYTESSESVELGSNVPNSTKPEGAAALPPGGNLTAATHVQLQGFEGRRYCTCRAEDAQILACSFFIPKIGPQGCPSASRPLGSADPLPVALLLPACAGPSRVCCCFCCCCCSCAKSTESGGVSYTTEKTRSATSHPKVKADMGTPGCGGLCSVASAIKLARLSGSSASSESCFGQQQQRLAFLKRSLLRACCGANITWANWRECIDVLEMSFLGLRNAPNTQNLLSLRKLELSENRLESIQGLLGLSLLEELLLDGNNLDTLNGIESLRRLECLDISNNKILAFPPAMQQMKRLIFLCAEANRLQHLQALEGLPSLTQLYLSKNDIPTFRSLMPLCRCPSLRVLDLRNTPVSREKEYRLYSLYLLPALKVLDGIERDEKETAEVKHVFAGRLTRELLEQIMQKPLPCLEGSVDLSGQRLRSISNVMTEENFPFLLRMNLSNNQITTIAPLGTLPLLRELLLAHNNIDIKTGGLGGSEGSGLLALPLLERLDLSFNTLRHLKELDGAPLGSIRILELRGNGLTRIEGLLQCSRLEVLDLSDNRIRQIEPKGFEGATESLRCLVLERNGLRSLCGLPCLPQLEELHVAQNRIPDLDQMDYLLHLPKLRQLGFQQNPACQRRQWRTVLAEHLPQLETIDGEPVSSKETSRNFKGSRDVLPREEDIGVTLHSVSSDVPRNIGLFAYQQLPHHQQLLMQHQLVTHHSAKSESPHLIPEPKAQAFPCSSRLALNKAGNAPSDVGVPIWGVVGVGTAGATHDTSFQSLQQRHGLPGGNWGKQEECPQCQLIAALVTGSHKYLEPASKVPLRIKRCEPEKVYQSVSQMSSAAAHNNRLSCQDSKKSKILCAEIRSSCLPAAAFLYTLQPPATLVASAGPAAQRSFTPNSLENSLASDDTRDEGLLGLPSVRQGVCLHTEAGAASLKRSKLFVTLERHKKTSS
ncbi:hypothetical protein Efla_000157 [Eimeria flavescens]